MNRRESIYSLFLTGGALLTLPAWATQWTRNDLQITSGVFNSTESALLTSIADTIIPVGTAIGALSVGVDKFLLKLFSDCYKTEVQDNIKTQLAKLNLLAKSKTGKEFMNCDQKQREAMLNDFAISTDANEKDFFNLMKSETIRGFNTSKEVMTTYLKYKAVPGHYYGCVDLKQS